MSKTLGRLDAMQAGKPVIYDSPERTVRAIISNQDAIIGAIQALCAKLDTNHGAASDHAATISNALKTLDLIE